MLQNRVKVYANFIAYSNSENGASGEEVQKVSKYLQSRPTIEAFKVNLLHGVEQHNWGCIIHHPFSKD